MLDELVKIYRTAYEQEHPIAKYIFQSLCEAGVVKPIDIAGGTGSIYANDDDEEGQWVTTENKHHVHLNESGVPDKGNPHVIEAMNGEEPAKTSAGGGTVQVSGPKQTKAYIDKYFAKHPDIKAVAQKYNGVMEKVANFQRDNPDAEDGTYSATTGERVDVTGYCVTFHQNLAADNPYGGYSPDDYAAMCAIAKHELGSKDVYIGYFGNAEVSFSCEDRETAMNFAIAHNQHSIYDSNADDVIVNPYYDPNTNPIENH